MSHSIAAPFLSFPHFSQPTLEPMAQIERRDGSSARSMLSVENCLLLQDQPKSSSPPKSSWKGKPRRGKSSRGNKLLFRCYHQAAGPPQGEASARRGARERETPAAR